MVIALTIEQLSESEQTVAIRVEEEVDRAEKIGREIFGYRSITVEVISIPVQEKPSAELINYLSAHCKPMKLNVHYDSKSGDVRLIRDN